MIELSRLILNLAQRFANFTQCFQQIKFAEWGIKPHNKYAEFFLFMPVYYYKRGAYICLSQRGPLEDAGVTGMALHYYPVYENRK